MEARGGVSAVAAFLERAAALTPDPARRAQRQLLAAAAKRDGGDLDAALMLLLAVEAGEIDELERARSELLRAQIALQQRRAEEAGSLFMSTTFAVSIATSVPAPMAIPTSACASAATRPARSRLSGRRRW